MQKDFPAQGANQHRDLEKEDGQQKREKAGVLQREQDVFKAHHAVDPDQGKHGDKDTYKFAKAVFC